MKGIQMSWSRSHFHDVFYKISIKGDVAISLNPSPSDGVLSYGAIN